MQLPRYSGAITAAPRSFASSSLLCPETTAAPFFSGQCLAVACPVHSAGGNVAAGCKCLEGYKGRVTATTVEPFYEGACTPVACPAFSTGSHVPGGCECLPGGAFQMRFTCVSGAGYSGSILGDDSKPYYEGSCSPVSCPQGARGTDIPSGCVCQAGYSGTVTASKLVRLFFSSFF